MADPNTPEYPAITATSFGQVTVGETVFHKDIVIRAGGAVKKRKKKIAKERYGTSHKIGPEELAKVCTGDPEILIIGLGQNGAAALMDSGETFLRERAIAFKAVPTPQAIREYNAATGRKAALIHVTC